MIRKIKELAALVVCVVVFIVGMVAALPYVIGAIVFLTLVLISLWVVAYRAKRNSRR